ncbi:MAG TPA: hypothetical protein PKW76_02065 [bacterium]|jgi:hypothetical protein|nr:hypothetical protein [bacterium]HPG44443.1 hypothetical protein [bacterium]HPM97001.1 hypothetical protein [bacterium]
MHAKKSDQQKSAEISLFFESKSIYTVFEYQADCKITANFLFFSKVRNTGQAAASTATAIWSLPEGETTARSQFRRCNAGGCRTQLKEGQYFFLKR